MVTIEVTQELIDNNHSYINGRARSCPVANAIRHATGTTDINVSSTGVLIALQYYPFPSKVGTYIRELDHCNVMGVKPTVQPFTFTIDTRS